MELWQLFLFLAALCAVIGVYRSIKNRGDDQHCASAETSPPLQGGSLTIDIKVPQAWNESAISRQIELSQNQPQVLIHYVEALRQRFILKTDDRTARLRTQFLRTHIEQLELGKQYQALVNDLRAMETEQQNRLLRLQVEQQELQAKSEHAAALKDLRLEKERLAAEVEIEQLKAQKRELRKSPQTSSLTSEQQRRLKRMEIEERIEDLDRQEAAALAKARDEDDRLRIQNMYAAKREELREQLSKHLV